MKATSSVYKCDTLKDWVEADGVYAAVGREVEPLETVIKRLPMADLMAAHSEATMVLCGHLHLTGRFRWEQALAAVCKAIGERFDALAQQVSEPEERTCCDGIGYCREHTPSGKLA